MPVAAGDVERDLRARGEYSRQRVAQPVEILAVADAALEPDVQRSAGLEGRIVVLGVHREGEHAVVALKECGRAVAVMGVAIDDGGALDAPVALQQAYRKGDVVEQAEALAVIVERVVKTAADVAGEAAGRGLEGRPRSGQRATGHEPQLLDDAHRPRQLEPANLHRGQRIGADLSKKLGGVDEGEIVPRYGLGFEELETTTGAQLAVDRFVLEHRKHVVSERHEVILGRVDEEHRLWFLVSGLWCVVYGAEL